MKKTTMALAALLLTACSSKDVYDPGFQESTTKQTYTANFTQKYAGVDLNQSWDYSNKNAAYSLGETSGARALTRATDFNFTAGEDYIIDNSTLTWMKAKLKEKKDNRSLGNPFYMTVPNNSFTIVPIFQGEASMAWELHVVVDGVDIKVWEKCQNLWVKKQATDQEWTSVADLSTNELYKNTMSAAEVKATPYTFENLPVGSNMYFYLLITYTGNTNKNMLGAQQSSLNGMMLALTDCPRPSNIDEDNEVMILGCEDLNTSSDWDMNDVVFMVYGKPYVPQPVKIEEGDPITKKTTVRYMIEDLGATDDFDFNDIVLDVSDIYTSTPVYRNGVLNSWTDSDHRQEAVIRHLGGELSFRLKIGDTQLDEHPGVLGSDPDETYSVSGWDINTHNISVEVRQSNNSEVYNHVAFPKAGEVPIIIAVDPTVQWMPERQSVPASWFYIPE